MSKTYRKNRKNSSHNKMSYKTKFNSNTYTDYINNYNYDDDYDDYDSYYYDDYDDYDDYDYKYINQKGM